ncbi:MAG TPA: metallophosphoesterase [Candidatus Gemmiger faecigallinarum]|nr:metallophosphoesterase [Candidatus Gemmiger faecigallinarum]
MYSHFIQFTIPRLGQALVALLLYLNFLQLPFVAVFAGSLPVLYYGLPLLLTAAVLYFARNPLGAGIVWAGVLTGVYAVCDLVGLVCRLIGGTVDTVWHTVYQGGLLAWAVTLVWLLYGRRRAQKLCTTAYRVHTAKPLPGGRLRIVQISDLHAGSTMHAGRADELRQRVDELKPDLLVLTGDIYDETTPRDAFDAYNRAFAGMQARWGKYFVFGNHDLGEYFASSSFTRADLESAFAAAGIRVLEDVAVTVPTGGGVLRIVGRKDWLFYQHRRFSPGELMPGGPDSRFTLWLDHEPRELKQAAAAGADLILCGHTHAGQLWPVGLVARLFRFNELNYGKKQIGGATAIVSAGTGTWGYRLRTAGRTEIVCVDVESSHA